VVKETGAWTSSFHRHFERLDCQVAVVQVTDCGFRSVVNSQIGQA